MKKAIEKQKDNNLSLYNDKEIKELLMNDERLVYVDTGVDEFVARYQDIPDVIVDINNKCGIMDLKVMDYHDPSFILLTTFGEFLNKCDSKVRADIIERLISLQTGEIEVKNYKVIDEDRLEVISEELNQIDEMER